MLKIAINGLGRIGRNVLRAIYESDYRSKVVVIAINEIASIEEIAYLLQFDSTHGKFMLDVRFEKNLLFVGDDKIHVFQQNCIENLLWKKLKIDIVLDCTGVYSSKKDGYVHLLNGAKKVLFSQLGSNDVDATIVYGINNNVLKKSDKIVSNASCTTNCIVPIIKVLDDVLKIESGLITVIHSSMNDQSVIDSYNKNLALSRSSLCSIVPVSTKISDGIARIMPKFQGCFKSISIRVPIINVTAIDLNILVKIKSNVNKVNNIFKCASKKLFKGIIDYIELPLVSKDFNHNSHSAIVDGNQTCVIKEKLIKVFVWCDNEWGFANRMIDTALLMK